MDLAFLCTTANFSVPQIFSYFGFELCALQAAAQDLAVRAEQDHARDGRYAVDVGGDGLRVDDARPGQVELLDGSLGSLRFVPYGHAEHFQSLALVLIVNLLER